VEVDPDWWTGRKALHKDFSPYLCRYLSRLAQKVSVCFPKSMERAPIAQKWAKLLVSLVKLVDTSVLLG
jgi:hypothetical protein